MLRVRSTTTERIREQVKGLPVGNEHSILYRDVDGGFAADSIISALLDEAVDKVNNWRNEQSRTAILRAPVRLDGRHSLRRACERHLSPPNADLLPVTYG